MIMIRRPKPVRINRSLGGNVVLILFLLFFGCFMVLPLVYTVITSFKPFYELWYFPPRFFVRHPTIDNYSDLLSVMSDSSVPFVRYVFNTFFIAIVGTGGHIILSSLCAYALAKHDFWGKKVIFEVIVLSLMFTGRVIAIPSYMIVSWLGIINTYWAYLLPAFSSSLGLYLMKQFMEQIVPDSVLEAARIDGAGEGRIFWRIVMPMVKPAWLTLIIFSFQSLWNVGSTNYIFQEELKTMNYALVQILSGGVARTGVAAAAAVVIMIVPIITFMITQRNVVETMATSGMKE